MIHSSPGPLKCPGHSHPSAGEVLPLCWRPLCGLHAVRVGGPGSIPLQGGCVLVWEHHFDLHCIHNCRMYTHACTHYNKYMLIHTHTTYKHTHLHTHHLHTRTYVHAYTHTYTRTYVHAYTHTYTHTYTHVHHTLVVPNI